MVCENISDIYENSGLINFYEWPYSCRYFPDFDYPRSAVLNSHESTRLAATLPTMRICGDMAYLLDTYAWVDYFIGSKKGEFVRGDSGG